MRRALSWFSPRIIFANTARAVNELVVEECTGAPDRELTEIAYGFIKEMFAAMQPLHRIGLRVLALWFCASALVRYGRMPWSLTFAQRRRLFRQWKKSRMGAKRDFIYFFITLGVVAVYDSEKMLRRLGVDQNRYLTLQCFYNSGVCKVKNHFDANAW